MWAPNIVHNCMAVKPGERVLLMTDEPLAALIIEPLREECLKAGASQFWVYLMPDASRPIAHYPPALHKLIQEVEVVIGLRAKTFPEVEGAAYLELAKSFHQGKARWGSGGKIDQDVLKTELEADFYAIAQLTDKLVKRLQGKKNVHLTTPLGTDLQFSIEGRQVQADTGLIHTPGEYGNLPGGEAFCAPLEDSANGILVIDKTLPKGLLSALVRVVFKEGHAVEISGGEDAEWLQHRIEVAKQKPFGEMADVIGELGIGTNPQAKLRGKVVTDEKVMGTVHVAIGNNYDHPIGGVNRAALHVDGVVGEPTLVVDGEVLIERGKYLVD
ncbi:MAG: aminopeptidase [Chloroflexi bacterium]|nr:aminopeptidase [Chloroflexota bacterium]